MTLCAFDMHVYNKRHLTYLRLEALLYLNHREYYHKPLSYKDRQPHGNVDHLTNIIVICQKSDGQMSQ